MLASLQTKAMLLGKNTFLRIDEDNVRKEMKENDSIN